MDIQDKGIQHVIYICGYRSNNIYEYCRMWKGNQSNC